MIKPDATQNGHTGGILSMINDAGFRIVAMKMVHLSAAKAGEFYAVHSERDRKSTRLNSSHRNTSRMPSSA